MKTTITINDKIYRTLKIQAAADGSSVSALVEDAIKYQILEDLEDLQAVKDAENEPTMLFEDLVEELKDEGLL